MQRWVFQTCRALQADLDTRTDTKHADVATQPDSTSSEVQVAEKHKQTRHSARRPRCLKAFHGEVKIAELIADEHPPGGMLHGTEAGNRTRQGSWKSQSGLGGT